MRKLFSIDSPIFVFFSSVADLIIISVMWTLFSLPIFTIGASTTAMYRVMLDLADDKGGGTIIQFWNAFRSNFKIGSIVFLTLLPAYAIIGVDIWCLFNLGLTRAVTLLFLVSAILIGAFLGYIFPLTAQFDNTVGQTIKNAFLLAASYPLRSLFILIMNLLPMILFVIKPYAFFYSLLLWPLLGFGIIARVNTAVLRDIFKPLIETQKENTQSHK